MFWVGFDHGVNPRESNVSSPFLYLINNPNPNPNPNPRNNPNPSPSPSPNPFVCDDFESDHFRMYGYKIKQCPVRRAHDWAVCPYAHKGERARRRDPLTTPYVGLPCPDYRGPCGACPRGDLCGYAHGVFEYWLHPARYRTRYCNARGSCTRPICFFAHSARELRAATVPAHMQTWLQDTILAELQARADRAVLTHGEVVPGPVGLGCGGGPATMTSARDDDMGHGGDNVVGLKLEFLENLRGLSLRDDYSQQGDYASSNNDRINSNVDVNDEPNLDWVSDLLAGWES